MPFALGQDTVLFNAYNFEEVKTTQSQGNVELFRVWALPFELHQAAVQLRIQGCQVIKHRAPALKPGYKKGRQRHIQQNALIQGLSYHQPQKL